MAVCAGRQEELDALLAKSRKQTNLGKSHIFDERIDDRLIQLKLTQLEENLQLARLDESMIAIAAWFILENGLMWFAANSKNIILGNGLANIHL